MQQTCRHIMELVKNSRNITVFVKGRITVRWEIEEDDSSDPQKSSFSFYYVRLPNCKYPYGIRAVGVGRPPRKLNFLLILIHTQIHGTILKDTVMH